MNIPVRLGKNFTTQFNKLITKYGTEMAKLNGIDEDQLSYVDFIDNFVDKEVTADSSVDENANVHTSNAATLLREMSKPHQILICMNKLYYEMQKKYGFKEANKWLELNFTRALYMHDMPTATFVHYCYKGEEMLLVKYKEKDYYTNFKNLYTLVDEKEVYDKTINQVAIFPKNLYVKDIDGFTKIKRIVKHSNNKPMRFIKTANGLSMIVTNDHPIITEEGEKPAESVTTEDKVYTVQPDFFTNKIKEIYTVHKPHCEWKDTGNFFLTKELGWLTGMILSEGTYDHSEITIPQNKGEIFDKIINICLKYDLPYYTYKKENEISRIIITMCPYTRWLSFMENQTSLNKTLPNDYQNYCHDFLDGIVAGMIDGDGTIDGYKHRHCQIRITSETLLHQISSYLNYKNIFTGDRTPHIYSSTKSYNQTLPLFGIGFTLTNENYFLNIGSIKINNKYEPRIRKGNFKNKKYNYSYEWSNIIENSEYIDNCPIVYDITTESGHFICNHQLAHNCFAYDLKNLAEKGLYFLKEHNAEPPKHLGTFCRFVTEHTGYFSNLSSGACGYPNLIPYLYYFWKKDKENNYLGISEWKRYAKQNIQELVYQWNQPITRDGLQSAFTNVSIFDSYYLEALFGGAEFPDGSFMVDELDEIMEFQKLFLETVEEIRGTNVMTYPVLSFSCLYDNGEFLDNDFVDWAIETDKEWMLCNWFGDSTVTSLSNCCRLKSDIEDLGYFNSIGSTALKVGSCKVSTINLARIALQSKSQDDFFVQLRDTCETNLKILDVQRSIIQRNVDKKLLPNFSCGEVDFDHLYSTVGILSPYETLRIFNLIEKDEFGNTFYTKEADKFVEKIYKVIHNTIDNFSLDKNYKINLEAIPGESAASKMMQADQLLFGDEVIDDLPLYANQYLPLGIQATLQERIRVAGLYSKFCGGGDILHANVDAPFKDNKKMKDMIKYIFDKGVKYFAFTSKISACEDNHGFYGDICPKCGKPAKYSYARVVGFWTKMENWSENRRKEGSMRKWENINED